MRLTVLGGPLGGQPSISLLPVHLVRGVLKTENCFQAQEK